MTVEMSEMDNGNVFVRVRSKRGTGTCDEDEVIVQAVYADIDEAEDKSHKINQLVCERMLEARELTDTQEKTGDVSSDSNRPDDSDHSKVYLGNGSRLGGWIPVPRQVVFEKIAPLVTKNRIDEEAIPGIKMNFSKDVPISGWNEVDADVVRNEIEPLIQNHRLDKSNVANSERM